MTLDSPAQAGHPIRQWKTLGCVVKVDDCWRKGRPSLRGIQHWKLRPAPSGQFETQQLNLWLAKRDDSFLEKINTINWRSKVSTTARQSLTYPTKLTIDRLTIVHRLPAHGAVTTTSEHLLDRSHLSDRLYVSISVSHTAVCNSSIFLANPGIYKQKLTH